MDTPNFRTDRRAVYAAVDTERNYQDAGRGNASIRPEDLSLGEQLLNIEALLHQARALWYTVGSTGTKPVLDQVRKIAGVAVACMEIHGAPPRRLAGVDVVYTSQPNGMHFRKDCGPGGAGIPSQ